MSQSPRKRPPDDKTERRKQPPGRKSKKDRRVGGLFQQWGGGGPAAATAQNLPAGNNVNLTAGMGINPVILPLFNQLITNVNNMTRLTNANVQALQSQGVATVSNKLTQRDKTTLQAAAGVEDKDDFTLSTVYDALIGEEGKTEER